MADAEFAPTPLTLDEEMKLHDVELALLPAIADEQAEDIRRFLDGHNDDSISDIGAAMSFNSFLDYMEARYGLNGVQVVKLIMVPLNAELEKRGK